ncbi:hypothetical protein [Lachnoclostridium phytofermentans]|nr:hypothetical protein [Lachnoclostridium phytofermentans]
MKKRHYCLTGLYLAFSIAGFICVVVNLCVGINNPWSLIPVSALIYVSMIIWSISKKRENRLIKTLAWGSGLLFLFLTVIQVVCLINKSSGFWLINPAFIIAGAWMLCIWAIVLCYKVFRLNLWISFGVGALFTMVANYITNDIDGSFQGFQEYLDSFFSYGFFNLLVGVILIIIGVITAIVKGIKKAIENRGMSGSLFALLCSPTIRKYREVLR